MKLKEGDELVSVSICYSNDDLILISEEGYCNKYSSEILSDLAAKAQGVMGINVKNDFLAGVAVDHHNNDELLLAAEKGAFKRMHKENLEYTSRNTKGYRIFRQVKSNPHRIQSVKMVSSYTNLYICDQGKTEEIPVSNIPFMDSEQTFSTPIKSSENYYFVKKDMSDILDVEIVDIPDGYYDSSSEDEQTTLFD